MKPSVALTCPQCGRSFAPPADRCEIDGAPLYGPEVMERIGQEIHNYRVLSILGEGGMGVVYKGEHVMLNKPVAIKVLHDRFARRKGAATQFLREARAASQIRHPNIVDVTDFGKAGDGSIYFVMEYLEGESLEDVLARDGRVPLFKAVNIVNQIARALAAAHEHEIVHQDLKPDNIFLINREGRRRIVRRVGRGDGRRFVVENEGRFDFVKLLDFGVAKFNEDNLGPGLKAKTGMVFGTPHYMSPETAQGLPVDHRSDIYALGILFYEMLAGVVPFESDSPLEILNGHVSGKVPSLIGHESGIDVDPATNATILRCLEKQPEDRFQSMDELCDALRDCFTDRVFLRDAERLPGAVEAGIVPPPRPARPPEGAGAAQAPAPQPRPATATGSQRPKRLTDELAELFAKPAQRRPAATPQPDSPVELKPKRSGEQPAVERAKTQAGLGAVRLPTPAPTDGSPPARKRRQTEPLASKSKDR